VLPIPEHLTVPDCFWPGRGTHTRDSGTVPGIPGQLVTLGCIRLFAESINIIAFMPRIRTR